MKGSLILVALIAMSEQVQAGCEPLSSFVLLQYQLDKQNTFQTYLGINMTECVNHCLGFDNYVNTHLINTFRPPLIVRTPIALCLCRQRAWGREKLG
eukprot:m.96087 g.96087  ORF g.96087 m.96087 type:complete len:97 (+) comp12350_c0_seq2:148-438(+)